MTKSFPALITEANKGKLEPFAAAVIQLPHIANDLIGFQLDQLSRTGVVQRRLNIPNIDNRGTSERYKYQAASAASGAFRSWVSGIERDAILTLTKSSLRGTGTFQAAVRLIRFGHGFGPARDLKPGLLGGLDVDEGSVRALVHHVVRQARKTRKLPTFRASTWVNLDNKVVTVQDPKSATRYQSWLKAATVVHGKPVLIPVYIPKGIRARIQAVKTIQARVAEDGEMQIRLVGQGAEPVVTPDPTRHVAVIGLDTGAVVPLATSEGDLYGRRFWQKVQHLDALIMRAVKGMHASGVQRPTESRRYQQLVGNLRGFVKNEIRRSLRCLLCTYTPDEIVVESLTFTNKPGLSRRMNRLLQRIGVGELQRALVDYSAEYGIKVTQVNPAYTSQQCPTCGHTDRTNRSGRSFSCRRCGREGHADVIGAMNIRNRRSVPGLHRQLGATAWLGGKSTALQHVTQVACPRGRPGSLRVESRPRAAGMAAALSVSLMSHDVSETPI